MNGDQVRQNLTIESSPVRGNHVHVPFKIAYIGVPPPLPLKKRILASRSLINAGQRFSN